VGISNDVGSFQLRDPSLEFVVQALLPRQPLLDALELPGLLLITLMLGLDNAPLMLTEYALLVGQLFEQPLDVVERGLRPLVVKLVELLASQHWQLTSSERKVASVEGRRLEKRRDGAITGR